MLSKTSHEEGEGFSFREVFATNPAALDIPWTESPFFDSLFETAERELSPEKREQVLGFARDGFLIIDMDLPDFDQRADRIVRELQSQYPSGNRRIAEAWYTQRDVRDLAAHSKIMDLLRLLYRREPIPFQTLNFEVGTEQATHSDTIHFHSAPARFMCGVWIALEDIDANNGPLHYYPGSHRLRDFSFDELVIPQGHDSYEVYEMFVNALMATHGFERKEVELKKGQGVIWAANLFHGGSPIRQPGRTRHSQVTHYYFEDCLYYVPRSSRLHVGEACLREVINIGTMDFVRPRYKGEVVELEGHEPLWRYPRPLPRCMGIDLRNRKRSGHAPPAFNRVPLRLGECYGRDDCGPTWLQRALNFEIDSG